MLLMLASFGCGSSRSGSGRHSRSRRRLGRRSRSCRHSSVPRVSIVDQFYG